MITKPRSLLTLPAAWLAAFVAVGCAINPVTGKRELALVSEAQEIEMGRQGSADVIASIGLVSNDGLQGYVNRIGQAVAHQSERPGLAWEFHVVDDASVNAFALPGGFIFVTRGLLAQMTTEAELASVLGHESGHVAARHSVQQISRQQVAEIGLGVGSVLSPAVEKYGQVAGAGLGLLFLKYGRGDENQADELGFRYALAGGYDTREMIDVFVMLQRGAALAGGGRLPEWQSTHPDPGNRISHVQGLVAASPQDFASKRIGGDAFLQQVDGLVYGVNPRAGFFRGNLFMHPDLEFLLQFPAGWSTHNAADAVSGLSPAKDALLQFSGARGTAAEAATAFLGQPGIQAGPRSQGTIHGNRSVSAEFSAQPDQGDAVRGIVTFIEYAGATWGILAYTPSGKFDSYSSVFRQSIASFDRLTDPVALAVQPMRLRIDPAPRAMSLQAFNVQLPSSIPLAELAMINGLAEDAQLRAGHKVKRVTGTPVAMLGARP